MARFAQYAMAATDEALEDAGWKPSAHEQREATVGSMSLMIESSLIFFFVLAGSLPGLWHWQLRRDLRHDFGI